MNQTYPYHHRNLDRERMKRAQAIARLDDDNLRRRLIRAYDENWNGGTDRLMQDMENAKEAE